MKCTILVILPDPTEREIFQKTFSNTYKVVFNNCVDEVIRHTHDLLCSVIVFDAGDANPESLTDLVRIKNENHLERPIILITSHNTFEIEKMVADIGVFYHLIRPYSIHDLGTLIETSLRSWRMTFGWAPGKTRPAPHRQAKGSAA